MRIGNIRMKDFLKEPTMRNFLSRASSILLVMVLAEPSPMLGSRNDLMAQTPGADAKVKVTVVNYDGLKDAVKDLKGKFVVVDFWSTT
jgi:hypothetical protein